MPILISNDMDQLCQKMPRPTSKFSLKAAYATLKKFALVMWWNALRFDEMTPCHAGWATPADVGSSASGRTRRP